MLKKLRITIISYEKCKANISSVLNVKNLQCAVHNWLVKILGLIYAFVLTKLWQSISASNKTCNERLHWKNFMIKFWNGKLNIMCVFFFLNIHGQPTR